MKSTGKREVWESVSFKEEVSPEGLSIQLRPGYNERSTKRGGLGF